MVIMFANTSPTIASIAKPNTNILTNIEATNKANPTSSHSIVPMLISEHFVSEIS